MAELTGLPAYTGSIGGLSAYRLRGTGKIVLRQKGGPTKRQVKTSGQYANTRKRNDEWKGCMQGVKLFNRAIQDIRHLADYNSTGTLSKLCRSVQDDDTTPGSFGTRGVLFSQHGYKLEGYGVNMYHPFDTVLRYPLQYAIDKQQGTAIIELPDIIPGIHLTNPMKQPFYRLVFVLGAVADMVYEKERKMYRPVANVVNQRSGTQTDWCLSTETTTAKTIALTINDWKMKKGVSLVLSAGVEYGQPVTGGVMKFTKYAGAGKVLGVV